MNTELTPLGRLIAAAQKDHQWSNRALERRAETLGLPGFTKTNIGKMKNEPPLHISTATIKNLAVLIQVPERVVVEAAIRSTNLEYPEANTAGAAEAIANDLRLSARDKRILLAAISAMTEEAGDGDGKATPLTDAGGTPATDFTWGRPSRVDYSEEQVEAFQLAESKRHLRSASSQDLGVPSLEASAAQDEGDDASVDNIMQHAAYEPTTDNPDDK